MDPAASDEVVFSRNDNDLMITLHAGDEITLARQLDEDQWHSIESVSFANGIILDQDQLRDRLVSDMKATGIVVCTENDENYSHSAGDGSYSILDFDPRTGNDTFVFNDVASNEVSAYRLESDPDDVMFVLDNGEAIRILDQLHASRDYGLEVVTFGDSVEWTRDDLAGLEILNELT